MLYKIHIHLFIASNPKKINFDCFYNLRLKSERIFFIDFLFLSLHNCSIKLTHLIDLRTILVSLNN